MIFNLMKPVPTTESATMYLYGHEAKADETPTAYIGDVGYVGEVLPKLPSWDKEKYPYVGIFFYQKTVFDSTPLYVLLFLSQIATVGIANILFSGGGSVKSYELLGDETEWRFVCEADIEEGSRILEATTTNALTLSENGWVNHDIPQEDGSIFMSASGEPIPVNQLVGYSYNGTVLPALPEENKEKYPYITIAYQKFFHFDYEDRWGEVVPAVHFATLPFASIDGDLVNAEGEGHDSPTIDMVEYFLVDGKWMCRSEHSWAMFSIITESLVFANYDILNYHNGEVYLSASEPVPVYEREVK